MVHYLVHLYLDGSLIRGLVESLDSILSRAQVYTHDVVCVYVCGVCMCMCVVYVCVWCVCVYVYVHICTYICMCIRAVRFFKKTNYRDYNSIILIKIIVFKPGAKSLLCGCMRVCVCPQGHKELVA